MKKEELINSINEDANEENGEIIEQNENGILYLDLYDGLEVFYRFEEFCTVENLSSLIFLGKETGKYGINATDCAKMLEKAFGDEFKDMMTTLKGIVIFSSEEDFVNGIKKLLADDFRETDFEDFSYEDVEDVIGRMWYWKQIAFVNEKLIRENAEELADEIFDFNDEYSWGIYQTLIHECRHVMLETNFFLDEEKYPPEENKEEMVEEYCRYKYDMLPKEFAKIKIK